MTMRDECIATLYEKASKKLPISREEYEFTLLGWELEPIIIRDEQIGIWLRYEHEVHVELEKTEAIKHGRRIIEAYFKRDLGLLGHLTTTSFKDAQTVQFLERLGFYKTNEDDQFFYYRADQSKF